jgi:hypothetical protein
VRPAHVGELRLSQPQAHHGSSPGGATSDDSSSETVTDSHLGRVATQRANRRARRGAVTEAWLSPRGRTAWRPRSPRRAPDLVSVALLRQKEHDRQPAHARSTQRVATGPPPTERGRPEPQRRVKAVAGPSKVVDQPSRLPIFILALGSGRWPDGSYDEWEPFVEGAATGRPWRDTYRHRTLSC